MLVFASASCSEIKIEIGGNDPVENEGSGENNENDGNREDGGSNDPSGTGKDNTVDTGGSEDENSGDVLDESEFTKILTIVWSAEGASVTGEAGLQVSTEGGHVTIGAPGVAGSKVRINMSGSCADGSLKIYNGVKADDTNKKILLSMEGLELKSSRGPAINIQSGKTVFVLLKDGTTNSLCDAANYAAAPEGEDAKGCFFSEKQLVFSGRGALCVRGLFKHAICVDDYLHIREGEITVSEASSDGVHTNEYVRIDGGSLNVTSKGEAIQCEEAENGYFLMTGGSITLKTSGEKSGGVETASDIIIKGGVIDIAAGGAAAKCLKSDNNVSVSGGRLTLKTTGGGVYDSFARETSAAACIRAENNVTLSGGEITCTSTGNGGKGINCYAFTSDDGAKLSITTSGSVYSYSQSKSRPKGLKATNILKVNGGEIDITTTGTEGEGLESKGNIEINGGTITINAKDDGINAAGVITFNGGYTYVCSSGNDGIDTNAGKANSIVVNGGVVITHSAAAPEEGFDADNHAYLTFNGGYVFCTGGLQGGGWRAGWGGPGGPGGGSGTSSNPTCSQPTFMWNTAASKGYFTVTDANGNVLMSFYVPRALSSNYSMVSGPMKSGQKYKCGFTTSAPTGAETVFGTLFYSSGTLSGLSKSFTASEGYFTL